MSGFEIERPSRNNSNPLIKSTIAGIFVLFVGGIGKYAWDLNQKIQEIYKQVERDFVLMAVHRADLDRLNSFMIEGKRFTLERGADLEDDLDQVIDEQRVLQLRVTKNTLSIAKLPVSLRYPFSEIWRRRISDLEKGQAVNSERIDKIRESLEKP